MEIRGEPFREQNKENGKSWIFIYTSKKGGFKHFVYVHLYLGKIPIVTSIFFQMGWLNHHLENNSVFGLWITLW